MENILLVLSIHEVAFDINIYRVRDLLIRIRQKQNIVFLNIFLQICISEILILNIDLYPILIIGTLQGDLQVLLWVGVRPLIHI